MCICFGDSIASVEFVVEEEAHFRDHIVAGNNQTPEKIVRGIIMKLCHRGL
jgi:hypothetical protein